MPENRYFIDSLFTPHEELIIDGEELHHLLHVMRLKEKEEVEIINGKGQLGKAVLQKISKKEASVQVLSVTEATAKAFRFILIQAVCRLHKLDFILEKGVELGVSEFWIFPGDFSEKQELTLNQKTRLCKILISALKQCGRLDLPPLIFKPKLQEWKETFSEEKVFFGDVRKEAPFFFDEKEKLPKSSIFFFIGPEKGFSPDEQEILEKMWKARGVQLHTNILRTETAALVAATQAFSLFHQK